MQFFCRRTSHQQGDSGQSQTVPARQRIPHDIHDFQFFRTSLGQLEEISGFRPDPGRAGSVRFAEKGDHGFVVRADPVGPDGIFHDLRDGSVGGGVGLQLVDVQNAFGVELDVHPAEPGEIIIGIVAGGARGKIILRENSALLLPVFAVARVEHVRKQAAFRDENPAAGARLFQHLHQVVEILFPLGRIPDMGGICRTEVEGMQRIDVHRKDVYVLPDFPQHRFRERILRDLAADGGMADRADLRVRLVLPDLLGPYPDHIAEVVERFASGQPAAAAELRILADIIHILPQTSVVLAPDFEFVRQ